ncbi:unnamed protein product, partial [marine sediment metagenome]
GCQLIGGKDGKNKVPYPPKADRHKTSWGFYGD